MAKTLIDLDEEALAFAAEVLGTRTKKDTVNAALRETGARARRERGLEQMIRLFQAGAFDASMRPEGGDRPCPERTVT
ncbi:type II toxin-antitoxin system VapB family antitoxin [Streptacidiphilus sp. MAP12-33]|uniref:type II toxin-antitoxin system VapB family antitoxin n=1 Tax=Streptacidiphilus sp. MAP12-33 TaxID=3156266 RepID=UPI0035165988